MLRPAAYFYGTVRNINEPLPVMGSPLPISAGKVIYDVHALGNPALWWLSTAAILFLVWVLAQRIWFWATSSQGANTSRFGGDWQAVDAWVALYFVLNYAANLLPWVRVTRCTFLYHYTSAYIFAMLALAWLVDRWLQSYRLELRAVGVTFILLILLAFVFWMPVYLGLPLSSEGYQLRMLNFSSKWLPHWI